MHGWHWLHLLWQLGGVEPNRLLSPNNKPRVESGGCLDDEEKQEDGEKRWSRVINKANFVEKINEEGIEEFMAIIK